VIRFRLSAEDRERLGAPEVIEYDEDKLRLSEARKLQKVTGLGPQQLADGLKAGDFEVLGALVWLALHRVGVDVPYDDLDFDLGALQDLDEEPGPQGKAPTPETTTST
jgi:hypothetical protein